MSKLSRKEKRKLERKLKHAKNLAFHNKSEMPKLENLLDKKRKNPVIEKKKEKEEKVEQFEKKKVSKEEIEKVGSIFKKKK